MCTPKNNDESILVTGKPDKLPKHEVTTKTHHVFAINKLIIIIVVVNNIHLPKNE